MGVDYAANRLLESQIHQLELMKLLETINNSSENGSESENEDEDEDE